MYTIFLFYCKKNLINEILIILMAGDEGVEPPLTVLETAVMPIYQSPIYVGSTMFLFEVYIIF